MATSALKLPNVIEPAKCILEDFEIIAFEKEEELDYYSYWNDSFRGKTFDNLVRQRDQTRSQQRSNNACQQNNLKLAPKPIVAETTTPRSSSSRDKKRSSSSSRSKTTQKQSSQLEQPQQQQPNEESLEVEQTSPSLPPIDQPTTALPVSSAQSKEQYTQNWPTVPGNGLEIINSSYYNTLPDGKILMKYKLTKLYNKLRGRQMRRQLVLERQQSKRIEAEIAKGHLGCWAAYTALQALRLPDSNINQLSTIAINHNPKFISIPQLNSNNTPNAKSSSSPAGKKKSGSQKKVPTKPTQQQQLPSNGPPLHYVYIDPNDIVTYSNRISPQQIIAYRRRSHLLPSSATSKKSSAASYDVYEIMEVLANSDKTNVTITRNANKPAPAGRSIYSHSVNVLNEGIVSTQLHLQARSYLDSVGKFYAEESARLMEEEDKLRNEPSVEEQISKYIKIDYPHDSPKEISLQNESIDQGQVSEHSEEDVIESLEEDILMMLNPDE